jgi:putative iron-regulated protein
VRRFSFRRVLRLVWPFIVVSVVSLSVGCRRSQPEGPSDAEIRGALATYARIAEASYDDCVATARQLVTSVDALVAAPSAASLQAARKAWLAARIPYAQTEVFRFYDGPIDGVEMLVNTWPIDEAYVEAQATGAAPGIIENSAQYPELTRALIVSLNAKEGETSIATGYHVIEFLLWGRDLQREGPGTRPYTDFVAGSDAFAVRRGQYLKLASELLLEHLQQVAEAWRDRPDSYRHRFETNPGRESLALMLKGMGALGGAELAGERLTVAYETKHQENEQSCFSDSTQQDLAGDALGIQNVCLGRYRKLDGTQVSGAGLCELVGLHASELGATLTAQIAASVAALQAIPTPFDTAILGKDDAPSRQAIAGAIAALQTQTQTLAQVAAHWHLAAPPTHKAAR